ncbi:hypothetical protein ACED25_05150 [Vibrio sp. 1F263]|uniref:hypothetical protein n=1 Tax=Vibrio sp. 1F263 TaxID=3230012 RepID=UPI00352EA804
MKKTILATTILSMISFGTLAQQVNVVEANKQTNALIENQISAIDASVLAQLEAQESSVAVVDGNLYQKDSEGGWAMVGATSAALVAGLFSGSSSNTSGSNGSDLPGNLPNIDAVNPVENTPANPIEATPDADNGRQVDQIADNMWQVSTHGEVDGYLRIVNGTVYVRDSDHNLVKEWKPTLGHPIQIDPANPIEATPDADNGRQVDQVADNMWQVSTHGEVDGYLSIVNGTVYVRDSDHNLVKEWKPTLGHPIQIDPANPIEATPDADNGRQVDQIADNMWQVSTHGEVDGYLSIENGTVYVRDSDHNLVTEWKPTLGHPIQIDPTNPIEATPDADNGRQVDQIADNMWQVSTHGEVDGYLSIENGTVYVRDSDHNLVTEWKPTLGHPIQIDPTNPIEATPDADNGRQLAKVGDNVWMITTHDAIDGYVIDERHHNDGVKVYDENGKLVNHITGDISTDGGYIESTKGGEIHITVDRESGRIDGIYLNDVAQQTVDNIKSHIGSNPNFKKNIQQLKNRVMNARG